MAIIYGGSKNSVLGLLMNAEHFVAGV